MHSIGLGRSWRKGKKKSHDTILPKDQVERSFAIATKPLITIHLLTLPFPYFTTRLQLRSLDHKSVGQLATPFQIHGSCDERKFVGQFLDSLNRRLSSSVPGFPVYAYQQGVRIVCLYILQGGSMFEGMKRDNSIVVIGCLQQCGR